MENKFINGDCMHPEYGLPSYPDKFFDLAVVDPPYGIGVGNVGIWQPAVVEKITIYKKSNWDSKKPDVDYWNELFRVSKKQMVWGGNYFSDVLPPSKHWIVWDKQQPENMHFNQFEMCWQSHGKGCRIFKRSVAKDANRVSNNRKIAAQYARIHPTQKPIALYQWLLENYATEGNLILDTHVGSASSLIACESMGFNYVGFELDADYYEAAKKRLRTVQARLF